MHQSWGRWGRALGHHRILSRALPLMLVLALFGYIAAVYRRVHLSVEDEFYARYHSVDDVISRLKHVIAYSCPRAQMKSIATTHEGRAVVMVRLGATHLEHPPQVLVTAGMHGRERSTSLVTLYSIEKFCRSLRDEHPDNPISRVELLIVPVLNPDGQERSRIVKEAWRKNRRPAPPDGKHDCGNHGVDLSRNWPEFWGMGNGTSSNPCHDQYAGPHALSEPESAGLAQVIHSNPNIAAHIDVHSFGQFIYRGRGYLLTARTAHEQALEKRQKALARAMRMAIRRQYGTDMVDVSAALATALLTNRSNGGTLLDYAMATGIPSLTFELAPRITAANIETGFATNATDLRMRSREMFDGFRALLAAVDPRGALPAFSDAEVGVVLP